MARKGGRYLKDHGDAEPRRVEFTEAAPARKPAVKPTSQPVLPPVTGAATETAPKKPADAPATKTKE